MSKYSNHCPPEIYDDEDGDDYDDFARPSDDRPQTNLIEELQQNTGIKIIPKIGVGAGLNKTNFDISLDVNAQQWFDHIHQYWKQFKKSKVLSDVVQKFYSNTPNPFVHGLKFFANANDHSTPKSSSFAYTVLEELLSFKKSIGPRAGELLDENTKMVAFNFLKKSGQISAFKLVVETFELIKSNQLFIAEIHELIAAKHFKEAGQIACDLHLYTEFTMEDFLIPLILEDKLGIFEDYLDKAVHLRAPTIALLDTFLHREQTVRQMCDKYIAKYGLTDVKYDKLNKKPLSKLVGRLMKKYHLPEAIVPNMKKHKEFGSLHFILRKNFVEKSLNQASFEEMVKDTIGVENKDLQAELVYTCLSYGSLADAVKWTKFYNVSLDDVPPLVRDTINGKPERQKVSSGWDDDDWDQPPASPQKPETSQKVEEIHALPSDARIVLVNSIPSYHDMINDLRCTKMIAFDTEWKPTIHSCNDVSLIQIAKREIIYLVDVISLMQVKMSDDDWGLLGRWIFNNDEILKLGFAHATDILMLMKFQPLGIQSSQQSSHSYLDLQSLWQKVANFPDFSFPFHDDSQSHSLSNLVKLCFGKKLDKSNQFSNWQQRPLRDEQIAYAALDAFCLFEIYDVIGKVISGMGINYDELIDNILIENKKQIASMTKKESRHQQQPQVRPVVVRKPIDVRKIRFVTDYMLGSLGKILRQVGIDTVILTNGNNDNDECIRISQNDDRVVLTASKWRSEKFAKHTKLGNTYLVAKSSNELEGLDEIVKHFKINVKRHNVFSRCMVCNCDEFLVASKIQMIKLRQEHSQISDYLVEFLKRPEEYSRISFPENKRLWNWKRFTNEVKTKYGMKIESKISEGTLKAFQTFYICEKCAKIYWDGGHYANSEGKLDSIFNLFQEAENSR